MIHVYNFLINLIVFFSPAIIISRILSKKEDPKRFLEKFAISSSRRKIGNLIWFHSVSVGELLSIVPIIKELEKKNYVSQILVTSSTLSSAKLFTKFNFKKTTHQFFPIDNNFFTNKFIDFWKPKIAFFIDSEVWPNMLKNLEKKKIPKVLLNARISNKSFKRWRLLGSFSEKIFNKIDYFFPQNLETGKFLKKLRVKKIKNLGNLKFIQNKDKNSIYKFNSKKFSNKKIWCAASTHEGEEKICIEVYKKLSEKYYDLLLIIIPRHINRLKKIEKILIKSKMNYQLHSTKKKINNQTNIYIVDTYGETDLFYKVSPYVFMGKSITKEGGQNPLEPARANCKIFYGPNVSNFSEIYDFLRKKKIAFKVQNKKSLYLALKKCLNNSKNNKKNNQLEKIGKTILKKNLIAIEKIILKYNAY